MLTMTEEMFNALMTYLQVRNEEDIEFYKNKLNEGYDLQLTITPHGEIYEKWE